jgi:hypothetical protein
MKQNLWILVLLAAAAAGQELPVTVWYGGGKAPRPLVTGAPFGASSRWRHCAHDPAPV